MIRMFAPFMSKEAIANAVCALQQRMIGEGETVKEFEAALCDRFDFRHALLLNNGTAGLRLSLAVVGVGPGDEVITTAMTCTATNAPILEQYAEPVFADIQWRTGNIDPSDIEHRITEKTKAIICVHWGGYPCDLDEIRTIAERHNLAVIEDAAHALGATYHRQYIGTYSPFTMFSFQAIKTLTTVDGGLLTTVFDCDYREAKQCRWFGIDRDQRTPSAQWPGYNYWPQTLPGYKYQGNNVQAAIGLGNLAHFDKLLAHRAEVAAFYREELADVAGLQCFEHLEDRRSAWWLFTVHVEKRQAFYEMMAARDIATSVCHVRNDLHPVFGGQRDDLPALDEFQHSYICIPIHHEVTMEDAGYVTEAIRGGW